MALAKRSTASQSGYDKRHDTQSRSEAWQPSSKMRSWFPLRRRRLILALIAVTGIYFFIKYMPTDLPTVDQRIDSRTGRSQGRTFLSDGLDSQKQSHDKVQKDQSYDGPVRFFNLAASLRPHLEDAPPKQNNVVFVLRDLTTAASLIGVACETATYKRTAVHVALFVPNKVSLDKILAVSGISQVDCPVYWHDARPEYPVQSSRSYQTAATQAALGHLRAGLKPTAWILDKQQLDDSNFEAAIHDRLAAMSTGLTILPNDALTSMAWFASLDAQAMSALNHVHIDIVITPYKHSAGSLIQSLKSIQSADYGGLPLPRITVEIPHDIDKFALSELESFQWVGHPSSSDPTLVLRKYLDNRVLTPGLSALHTIESFYPPRWPMSHVLILNPDAELSAEYLHYLMYLTLEYKYGSKVQRLIGQLMGISLDLPKDTSSNQHATPSKDSTLPQGLFLSHTPSSIGTLYFGDKWVELQDYLALRLKYNPTLSKIPSHSSVLNQDHPSWLREISIFTEARNYFILHPGFSRDEATRLLTSHTELHQDPEEYAHLLNPTNQQTHEGKEPSIPHLDENTILTDENDPFRKHARLDHAQSRPSPRSITKLLGLRNRETLPLDQNLPILSSGGTIISYEEAESRAEAFANSFSIEVGGCASLDDRADEKEGTVGYLFCEQK